MYPPAFSNDAFDELADWLTRRRTGITDVVELEGFLTALVIGPNTVSPMLWLPKVWDEWCWGFLKGMRLDV